MKHAHLALLAALGATLPARLHAQDAEAPLTDADFAQLEAAATGAPGEARPMTQAELESLGITSAAPTVDKRLQFSGFADFGFTALLIPKNNVWRSLNVGPPHPSFYVGNINLYMSKYLTEKLFMLGEIRFTYLPNGSSTFGVQERTSTVASDYNDFGRSMRWGGIEVERFHLDWIAHPRVSVRMGQFLTPFGIWNVDHGSPTIIAPARPWMIAAGWFPERQTGIEVLGSYDVSTYGTIGYHVTLSNGTGPVSEYADLDDNKAIGARFFWDYRRMGRLRVGASAYYGRDTDTKSGVVTNNDGSYDAVEKVRAQFDSLAVAADAQWAFRGVHLQTEVIVSQKAYTKKGRTIDALFLSSSAVPADLVSWGAYGLVGYRFEWGGIMPFIRVEKDKTDMLGVPVDLVSLEPGINIRPVDVFVFKLAYEHILIREDIWKHRPSRAIQAQVAWAF